MAVVSALSSVLDVSPVSMPPLAETIDTDALDRLVRGDDANGDVEVSWTQAGVSVTVTSDDAVTVSLAGDDGTPPSVQQ